LELQFSLLVRETFLAKSIDYVA